MKYFTKQLLKQVGSKQKFASQIISYFPKTFNTYFEPFLGSGAVLATLDHTNSIGSDALKPLIDIQIDLRYDPERLIQEYKKRYDLLDGNNKKEVYEHIKCSYNLKPNGGDLLYLCRACYGGIVRFRQADGYMSTQCGEHDPISVDSFSERVYLWHDKVQNAKFFCIDYRDVMDYAKEGDLIYCDPPYVRSQSILYGSQFFKFSQLTEKIAECKKRGVFVALSIDGSKKSDRSICKVQIPIPEGLFEREIFIDTGKSMLKRFQSAGSTVEKEIVMDRLLLTY